MSIFRLPKAHNLSKKEQQDLWNKIVTDKLVIFHPDDDKKFNFWILNDYLERKDGGYFNFNAPHADPMFAAKVKEYEDAWNEFKPTMINTSKTFTTK